VSSDDGLSSCQVQFELCASYVRAHRPVGWLLLPDRFDDGGYSGAITDRPALQRLLALVRNREVDRLVIHRLDQLSRSLLGCASLLHDLREYGVGLVIVTAPELGCRAQDAFMLNILASFAEFERQVIAGRFAESRARLKARGMRIAGAVPFGYDADLRTKQLVPNIGESAVVRWMFEQAAAGQTPSEIADGANVKGWRTKEHTDRRTGTRRGGNPWTARQVIATLRNPVYLGLFRENMISRLATTSRSSQTSCSRPQWHSFRRGERECRASTTRLAGLCRGALRARPATDRCRRTPSGIEISFTDITGAGRLEKAGNPVDIRFPHL